MANQTPGIDAFGDTIEVRSLGDYATGQGYDALKFVHATPALETFQPTPAGRSFGNTKVWAATSARELVQKLEAELDMKATYLGVEGGVVAKLIESFTYNETSFMIIARQTIEAGSLTIVNDPGKIRLREDASERLQTDLARFHRKYGGYYCHTVVLGGEVYVAYQCTLRTRARASEVSAKIEGSYPDLGSLMAKMSATMEATEEESRWTMTVQTLGAGGTIGEFDPTDPDSVREAVMKFLETFEKNVREKPEAYYGRYDGYWRFFAEAEQLKEKVYQTSLVVDELCSWGTAYADLIASINAFLDPENGEGYSPSAADRVKLEKLREAIRTGAKTLADEFARMELFDEFHLPQDIEALREHDPEGYHETIENWRDRLVPQLVYGQEIILYWEASNYYLDEASLSVRRDEPEVDPAESPFGEQWPYLRLSHVHATKYRLRGTGEKGKDSEVLRNGDVIRIEQIEEAYRGQQLYMPWRPGVWTVWSASFDGNEHKKYEWKVVLTNGKMEDKDPVTTSTEMKLVNENAPDYWMYPSGDYLGVTDRATDDWKVRFVKVGP